MTVVTTTYGYLEDEYLEGPYLTTHALGASGLQVQFVINKSAAQGLETQRKIVDFPKPVGLQVQRKIDETAAYGLQTKREIDGDDPNALQTQRKIVDFPNFNALQTQRRIDTTEPFGLETKRKILDFPRAYGVQAQQIVTKKYGLQAFIQIYNTNRLRILTEFASRGTVGNNWTANSIQTGDFSPLNVNTDIEEQTYRSAIGATAGVQISCDTQINQGVFVDTLAIRNHNLTRSATVVLQASNSPTFTPVLFSINLSVTQEHMYYISPELPTVGYRYWRFVIDDALNPDNYIEIGTILFGRARIFQGECHTDEIGFAFKDFADTVPTKGYTNVSNSQALKRVLNLEFRLLRFDLPNFRILRDIGTTFRTTHKLLWIPTPDPIDQTVTGRFAVFGKLSEVPRETHNYKGERADYVTLSVEIDESR